MNAPRRTRMAIGASLLAGAFALAGAGVALADAGDPMPEATVVRDGLTVTLSGTWVWPEQDAPCGPGTSTNRAAGWAADWGDGFTGNFVKSKDAPAGVGYHMGSATDNLVRTSDANGGLGDCGTALPGGGVTGTWGPISHTYEAPGTYDICVVIYDVHYTGTGDAIVPKSAKELRAGGADHNGDNSAEKNSSRDPLRYGYQCASARIFDPAPAISLDKSATETSYDAPGDVLHYSLLVTNTGNVPLAGPVTVDDDLATDEACPALTGIGDLDDELDVGESVTCTATVTIDQADLDAGSVTNTATASVDEVDSPSDSVTVDADQLPALTLDKTALDADFDEVGDVIRYRFLVTNSGNVRIHGPVTIADDVTTDESCPAVTTIGNHDAWLDVGESVTCTATATIIRADLDRGELVNTASASAGDVTSPTDAVTTPALKVSAIRLVKSVQETEFAQAAGQLIHFDFTVTNTGNVRLEGPVTIDDPMTTDEACPSLTTIGNLDAWFDPDETIVCTGSYVTTEADVLAKHVDNTATASVGPVDSPPDTAEVKMAPTLAVLLDASGSMHARAKATVRRYNRLLAEWQAKTELAPYSLTLFNSFRYAERYVDVTIAGVPDLTLKSLRATGKTPLYDAAVRAIRALEARHPIGQVVFVISTDGKDNASTTETKRSLARLIRHMKRTHDWRFVFDGESLASLAAAVGD